MIFSQTIITRGVAFLLVGALALVVAGCTAAQNATLVSIDGALASVSCPAVASGGNTIADNVITITAPTAAAAASDAQLAAASANLFAELCPALQGAAGLVVQATVDSSLSGTPAQVITSASLGAAEARAALRRRLHGLPFFMVTAPACVTVSLSPYEIQCAINPR